MSTTATSTAIAERTPMQETLAQLRHPQFLEQVRNALPGNVTPERFVRVALTAIQQTPELVTVDRPSLFGAIVRCAQDGLLPDGREAALVVFGGKAQYMSMIFGLRKIAANHGFSLEAHVVREHDLFEWELGFDPKVRHVPPPLSEPRGEIIGAYSVATNLRSGQKYLEVMSRQEIDDVRKMSKAPNSAAWAKSYGEMARKTVGRRNFKQLPLGDLDEREDSILRQADVDVEHDNGAAMTLDEANIAAGLTGARPPADKGPDDSAPTGDAGGDDPAGEIVGEHDTDPADPATAEQHARLLELVVALTSHDPATDWRQQALTLVQAEAFTDLTGPEMQTVLDHLAAQLPTEQKKSGGRAS